MANANLIVLLVFLLLAIRDATRKDWGWCAARGLLLAFALLYTGVVG